MKDEKIIKLNNLIYDGQGIIYLALFVGWTVQVFL